MVIAADYPGHLVDDDHLLQLGDLDLDVSIVFADLFRRHDISGRARFAAS
jgi:hypothetical protein